MKTSSVLLPKLRERIALWPQLLRAVRLVWQVARWWTIYWIALLIFQGILPAVGVYLTKLLVNGIVSALSNGATPSEFRTVLILVAGLGSVLVLIEATRAAIGWIRTVQAEFLQDHINNLIHEKSIAADLAFYEFPDFFDHLHRARAEAEYRPAALLENLASLLQNSVTLVAMAAVLIPLGPWLTLALLFSTLPAFFVVLRYSLTEYEWRLRNTADERRLWYYDWLMTAGETAAELRLFRLGGHFRTLYQSLRRKLRLERLQIAKRHGLAEFAASLIALLISGAALTWMVWRALQGQVTLGDLALVYAAFNQGQRLMRALLENVGQIYANTLFIGNLFQFLSLEPMVTEPAPETAHPLNEVQDEIRFTGVTFSYPNSDRAALEDFSLTIPAGQIAAIVGPNGAGKSTLIKLLCRFYDPDRGRVEIDRTDLKTVPTRQLRRMMTVLFQEPVHYNATVLENVGYGDLELNATLEEIEAAVKAAGAETIIEQHPEGYETLLGKWFTGGTELSTGEWQRLALARAFLRRAPIIILDEPTSALDPWAEADWLQRFRRLAMNRTAIIITHRFTTAMHADVIHVMDGGRIVESGTHERLVAQNGRYSGSWTKQMSAAEVTLNQEA